jgi:hypothetical protein
MIMHNISSKITIALKRNAELCASTICPLRWLGVREEERSEATPWVFFARYFSVTVSPSAYQTACSCLPLGIIFPFSRAALALQGIIIIHEVKLVWIKVA